MISPMILRLSKGVSLLFAILFVQVASKCVVWAADKQSEGMALIQHSIELTDLRKSGPYHMRSRLTVADEAVGQREGTDLVIYSSTALWRRDLHITGYDEVAVFVGHRMYRTRSMSFTPPSLRVDIAGSLRNLPETLSYKILRVFNRKVNDVDSRCVYLQQVNDQPAEVTWCFDRKTGLPSTELSSNGMRQVEFSNYKPFGSKFVPGAIAVVVQGKSKGNAVLETIDSGIPDPAHSFAPPMGAAARLWCDDMHGLRRISGKTPDIPAGARSHSGLELNYELTVDEQGNVTDIVPMAAKPFVDRIVIETLRAWQMAPALCDGTPVPTDTWLDLGAMMHW
jgi:hypothetical protein